MSKVTWSVPLVQFGRCEVEFDFGDFYKDNPEQLGRDYAKFVAGAMRGYEAEREKVAAKLKSEERAKGRKAIAKELEPNDTQENYNAPAEVLPEPTEESLDGYNFDGPGDVEAAAQRLIEEELGATVVGKTPVWDEPVKESPKPWKGSGPVKKITDIQF